MALEEVKRNVKGMLAFAVTPFKDEPGAPEPIVDEEGLRRNIRFLLKHEIYCIVTCAGTGEIGNLTMDEHRRVVRIVAEEARGKAVVFAGVGQRTAVAVQMARNAQEGGCDGVLVIPLPLQEEPLHQHYKTIAQAVDIGVMAFRNPSSPFSLNFLSRLAEIPNVIAIKEETGDILAFRKMVLAGGHRFAYVGGGEMLAPYYFLAGGHGITTGLMNFIPQFSIEMYQAAVKGDWGAVMAIQKKLQPISDLRGKPGNGISLVKEAMDMLGLTGGSLRPPMAPLSREDREELRRLLADLGAL